MIVPEGQKGCLDDLGHHHYWSACMQTESGGMSRPEHSVARTSSRPLNDETQPKAIQYEACIAQASPIFAVGAVCMLADLSRFL